MSQKSRKYRKGQNRRQTPTSFPAKSSHNSWEVPGAVRPFGAKNPAVWAPNAPRGAQTVPPSHPNLLPKRNHQLPLNVFFVATTRVPGPPHDRPEACYGKLFRGFFFPSAQRIFRIDSFRAGGRACLHGLTAPGPPFRARKPFGLFFFFFCPSGLPPFATLIS